ncbi:hypothetical protein CNMCM6106_000820 [Aspergillus hiratsukae]|uniref:CBS domain-containing protein n=1 Tax=Aspergillus hiratsukae TaxID=1194566 RepID=A0A8H6Q1T0_9EURO|nr:hypothetical protein CNMCM6106_000820 [Aspergillus hiratsukae]
MSVQKLDRKSGQVYEEQAMVPSLSFSMGPSWVHESPFCTAERDARHQKGSPSLKECVMEGLLSDQRDLTPELFRHIPWRIASSLWDYFGRRHRRTLYMWKLYATAYPAEFWGVAKYRSMKVSCPQMTLREYWSVVKSDSLSWRSVLTLNPSFGRAPELVEIAYIKNLVALEIGRPLHLLQMPDNSEPHLAGLNDRIARTWSELAESSGAFSHLRVLRLYFQPDLSPMGIRYLSALPGLCLIIAHGCPALEFCLKGESLDTDGWEVTTTPQFAVKSCDQLEGAEPRTLYECYQTSFDARSDGHAIEEGILDRGSPVLNFRIVPEVAITEAAVFNLFSETELAISLLSFPEGQLPRGLAPSPRSAMADPQNLEGVADQSNGSTLASPRSSSDSRSPSTRSQSLRLNHSNHQHRQSFSESLRAAPGSPRTRRQPSFTQAAIQSLIDNPPAPKDVNPAFAGRDWREISIGELVRPDDLRFVELDTGIEEATNTLIDSNAPVLLIRETPQHKTAVGTFDYSDLNGYLLLAAGLTQPNEELRESYEELARKAREGHKIPLKDVKELSRSEPLTTLPASANLMTAVETFGGGVHRVIVVDERKDGDVVGIVSQFRLVKFLWENGRSFPVIDQLYPQYLRDLGIGSREVISINGDKLLCEALQIMHSEGISSIAVVDNHFNVVGNISTTDVKLLTRSSSLPLLHNTCIHFISVILSARGLIEGKDSFPVFYVNPGSTLAHTVAKLVATKSHRLWVTDPLSPSSSGPPTPSHSSVQLPLAASTNPTQSPPVSPPPSMTSLPAPNYSSPHLPSPPQPFMNAASLTHPAASVGLPHAVAPSIPASALPGARLSGRLVGVVSLTDILNLHARASGLSPADPAESRSRRRRSSSSSLSYADSGNTVSVTTVYTSGGAQFPHPLDPRSAQPPLHPGTDQPDPALVIADSRGVVWPVKPTPTHAKANGYRNPYIICYLLKSNISVPVSVTELTVAAAAVAVFGLVWLA